MKSRIEQLRKEYLEKSNCDKSKIYAYMGALGVSPAHLKAYEDSLEIIEKRS